MNFLPGPLGESWLRGRVHARGINAEVKAREGEKYGCCCKVTRDSKVRQRDGFDEVDDLSCSLRPANPCCLLDVFSKNKVSSVGFLAFFAHRL